MRTPDWSLGLDLFEPVRTRYNIHLQPACTVTPTANAILELVYDTGPSDPEALKRLLIASVGLPQDFLAQQKVKDIRQRA
jgi:hypothetical protein